MAEQQLSINIGADTKDLSAALRQARKEIDDFEKKVGLVAPTSAKAGLALSNLGRVASDAPFGFIAIQNNIEPLLQSFQSLSKESGGTGSALKALGKSLFGPTGLLLGFSLVSSAITVAIQKYGSLGGAIDAIFGKQDSLNQEIKSAAESYEKFNKELKTSVTIQSNAAGSVQGEVSRVQALASIVNSTTTSYLERNNALKELATINKTYFGNLDDESVKLGKLTEAVDAYTKANVEAAISKAFESEIAATSVELSKQERLLGKYITRLGETATAQNKVSQTLPGLAQAAEQSRVGSAAISATEAYIDQNTKVNELRGRIKELNDELKKSVISYNSITAPINAANEAQKKKEEQDKKEIENTKKKTAELKREAEARAKSLAEILARGSKVQTIDFTSFFDLDPAAAREKYTKLFAPVGSAFQEALAPSQGKLGRDFTIIPPAAIQTAIDDVNKLRDAGLAAGAAFSSVITPAIDSVFAALESGENVIQSLGQAFKKLVVDLIKATIKAAGLALVISAASGGKISFGTAFRGSLGLTGGGNGLGGLRGAAAPTFGGVSGFGGGLQLAGQVVFTQRGTDLVGVLNSSNARINRVG